MVVRLYPESTLAMSESERELFWKAYEAHAKKCADKGRSEPDTERLSRAAGERAVLRSRPRMLSAQARTLDLFGAR